MSSADGVTRPRLSRNDGTRASTLRRKATARDGSPPVLSHDLHQGLITLDHFRRPRRGKCRQPPHRILQDPGVIPFGRKTRPLDQHCRILRLKRHQPFQFLLSVGVGVRSAGVLDLLHQRRPREEIRSDRARRRAAAARSLRRGDRATCRAVPSEMRYRSRKAPAPPRVQAPGSQSRSHRAADMTVQDWPRQPVRLARARSPGRIPAGRRRSGPLAGRQSHGRSAVSSARRRQTTARAARGATGRRSSCLLPRRPSSSAMRCEDNSFSARCRRHHEIALR